MDPIVVWDALDVGGFLALAAKFPTALIGAVGFAGVILTLRGNRRKAWALRRKDLERDREAVRIALMTELTFAHQDLRAFAATMDFGLKPRGAVAVTSLGYSQAYDVFLPKLSLLDEEQVEHVSWAYHALKDFPNRMLNLPTARIRETKTWVDPEDFHTVYTHVTWTLGLVSRAMESLDFDEAGSKIIPRFRARFLDIKMKTPGDSPLSPGTRSDGARPSPVQTR